MAIALTMPQWTTSGQASSTLRLAELLIDTGLELQSKDNMSATVVHFEGSGLQFRAAPGGGAAETAAAPSAGGGGGDASGSGGGASGSGPAPASAPPAAPAPAPAPAPAAPAPSSSGGSSTLD